MKTNIYKKILETEINKLLPLLSFGSNLNTLYNLHDLGMNPSIHVMIIPAFISIYGGSLVSNLIYKNFSFTFESIIYFITSLIVFNIIHNVVLIKKSLKFCSIIGKGLGFVSNKNIKEDFPTLLGRLMVSEVFNQTFKKVYFPSSEFEFTPKSFNTFVFNICILIFSKLFQIPDYYLFGTIIFIELRPIIEKMFFREEIIIKKTKKTEIQIPETKIKRPIRRSSIANLSNKY